MAALAVLLVNDHVLKGRYPGIVTGKLSDVAGLFLVGALLYALRPRHYRISAACLTAAFALWKSPAADPLIAWWNGLGGIVVGRTVDVTDLVALLVLPFVPRALVWPMPRLPRAVVSVPILALTVLGVTATSKIGDRVAFAPGEVHVTVALAYRDVMPMLQRTRATPDTACAIKGCEVVWSDTAVCYMPMVAWVTLDSLGLAQSRVALRDVRVQSECLKRLTGRTPIAESFERFVRNATQMPPSRNGT